MLSAAKHLIVDSARIRRDASLRSAMTWLCNLQSAICNRQLHRSPQLIHMLLHFAQRRNRVVYARAIVQQHAPIDPDRLALSGALGDREVLRAEVEALGEQLGDRVVFGRWPKQ